MPDPQPYQRRTARKVAAEELQTILGDHQDSVVARGLLRRWAAEAQLRGENAFSYGCLDALEQCATANSEARFLRAWASFPRPSLSA